MDLLWLFGQVSRGLSAAAVVLLAGAVLLLVGKAIGAGLQLLPVRRLGVAVGWVAVFTAVCLVAALTVAALTALLITAAVVVAAGHWWRGTSELVNLEARP